MMEKPNCHNSDAEKMFKLYVIDYLVKRNKLQTAMVFAKEAGVELYPPGIDCPVSFLSEWWTVFYAAFMSRKNCPEAQNKGKQIIAHDKDDDQFQPPKSDIGPEMPVQKGKQIIGNGEHDVGFRLKGKQIIDGQIQLSKADIGPEKPVQFSFESDIPKLLGQREIEQLAYGPGVLCSSSQFPVTDFSDLQNSVGSKSNNSWINKNPQQLMQEQLQPDQHGGSILNFGGSANDSASGASGAMLRNRASNNLDFENAANYKPMHGWPMHGAGQMPTSTQMEVKALSSHGPNYLPEIQLPTPQSQRERQFMGHTAGRGTSTPPGNSFDLSNINPTLLQNGLGGSIGQNNGSNDLSSLQHYLMGLMDMK